MIAKQSAETEGLLTVTMDPFAEDFLPDERAKGKSHFQASFFLMGSQDKRQAISDLYSFCRLADDIADSSEWKLTPEERHQVLNSLIDWIRGNHTSSHPFWTRWQKEIAEFKIPQRALQSLVEACRRDILTDGEFLLIETWEELDTYCYGVAGCVGECVMAILGETHTQAVNYSHAMGRSLQYLNIMRDIEEDFNNDRIYIPQEFLRKLSGQRSAKDRLSPEILPQIREELYARAQKFRDQAKVFSKKCLAPEIMAALYWTAARKYWRAGNPRRLSKMEKLWISLKTLLSLRLA